MPHSLGPLGRTILVKFSLVAAAMDSWTFDKRARNKINQHLVAHKKLGSQVNSACRQRKARRRS
jgi:hypothetical protein